MTRIPSKPEILEWISENPTLTAKRDIAKAFGIKGAARIDLKRLLKELEAEGHLEKRKKTYQDPDRLPPVSVLQVLPPDADGDLFAAPMEWHGTGVEPRVLVIPRASDPALGGGRPYSGPANTGAGTRLSLRGSANSAHRHQPAPCVRRVSQRR